MRLVLLCLDKGISIRYILDMNNNIYIVGFMGTGKSTVGKILSSKLKMQFVETDDVIEKKENMRITDIFSKKGEKYFRAIEKEVLKEISARDNLIVSCGGGLVIDENNVSIMKNTGVVVCLKADEKTIYERVKKDKSRPLLNVSDPVRRIRELLKSRAPFYDRADIFIDTADISPIGVAAKIVDNLDNV